MFLAPTGNSFHSHILLHLLNISKLFGVFILRLVRVNFSAFHTHFLFDHLLIFLFPRSLALIFRHLLLFFILLRLLLISGMSRVCLTASYSSVSLSLLFFLHGSCLIESLFPELRIIMPFKELESSFESINYVAFLFQEVDKHFPFGIFSECPYITDNDLSELGSSQCHIDSAILRAEPKFSFRIAPHTWEDDCFLFGSLVAVDGVNHVTHVNVFQSSL